MRKTRPHHVYYCSTERQGRQEGTGKLFLTCPYKHGEGWQSKSKLLLAHAGQVPALAPPPPRERDERLGAVWPPSRSGKQPPQDLSLGRARRQHLRRWPWRCGKPNQKTRLGPIFELFRLCKGGISYAVQGSFCEHILPRFYAETMFDLVDCEAILDSIVRGPTIPAAPLATR